MSPIPKSGRKSVTLQVETAPSATAPVSLNTPSSARSIPSPNPAQDTHPFARGAVIEVLHIPTWSQNSNPDDEWYWTESDDDSDEDMNNDNNGEMHSTSNIDSNSDTKSIEKKASTKRKGCTVRLCDVIDRTQMGTEWKYYIHYRDFNRRMDEWISTDRIVSPPSIGNAKARMLKKEQERQKRKLQRKKEEAAVDLSAPRQRRRRSSVAAGEGDEPRRRRLSRRKSMDDDGTVVAGNTSEEQQKDEGTKEYPKPSNKKEILALPTDSVTTQTIGGHVLATIHAVELDEHEGLDEQSLREHEEVTKVKNVNFLEMGQYQMETWYYSPFPKELIGPAGFIEVLYVCEFTLKFFSRKKELLRSQSRLPVEKRHPPGDEIYRKGNLAMFEVDAQQEEIYCQNLSYVAKLFLDHKTLYFSVSPFLFYVLCEVDDRGYHPVGYFSKEKYSDVGYNLACILTFPAHQRKGYGRFIISFSYELSKKEEKVGSPEKPMSDLGQQAYKPYWISIIIDFLLNRSDESALSIMDISKRTSIFAEDIVFTLNQLGLMKLINGVYFITAEKSMLQSLAKRYPIKEPIVDPARLHWTPFLTDVKRDKFSIHSKKPSVTEDSSKPKTN